MCTFIMWNIWIFCHSNLFFLPTVEDAAGLLLPSEGVRGVDDETVGGVSVAGASGPVIGPRGALSHAGMVSIGE